MEKTEIMLLLPFGYPGCGKGTVMRYVMENNANNAKVKFISVGMGDYFRAEAKIDEKTKDVMERGELINNSRANKVFELLVFKAIAEYFATTPTSKLAERLIVIVDGYPRAVPQWDHFVDFVRKYRQILQIAAVFVEIEVSEIRKRASVRRICECGRTFIANPNGCPDCGKAGYPRPDDVNIETRITVFNRNTAPVIEMAKNIIVKQITVSGHDTAMAAQQVAKMLEL